MTDTFSARLAGSAAAIGEGVWDALANPARHARPYPFTRHAFFRAVEESGSAAPKTGWSPAHLMVERAGRPAGLMPLYVKSHSFGEYVFDHGWAEAFERAGGAYYPKLQAAVPFTPVTGKKLLIGADENERKVSLALLQAGANAVEETRTSSLHLTFVAKSEWELAGAADYLLRTDKQFHWENRGYASFEDFLGALASAKRKNLRKERANVRAEGISFDWLSGSDLTEDAWDAFFRGYQATGNTKWNRPYLTRDFFSRIGATMGEQILLVMAKRNGRYIAGALNFMDGETLYGRNWGCTEYVPFLHFDCCYYQAIDFAIARGLKRVEAGAQGGHKLLRGYLPVQTYSAHYIAHASLRDAIARYLASEREAVAEQIDELSEMAPFKKGF